MPTGYGPDVPSDVVLAARPTPRGAPHERQRWAEELLDRLTPVMGPLGVVFALVVLGQLLARAGSALATTLAVVGWLLWAAFVLEFAVRLVVAPDRLCFLRHHWWQLVFLALPFLRILRLVRSLRLLRAGRVLSSTLRGSRSAGQLLRGRLGWLAGVVVMVVLGASQLLYEFADFPSYGAALHAAALGAITGEPLGVDGPVAAVAEVLLAGFSVVVFGTLAGALGAFFLQRYAAADPSPTEGEPPSSPRGDD